MKVIFLDVDGVLNCDTTEETINGWTFVDDYKIKLIRHIMTKTDAKVVLSSSWRSGYYGLETGHSNTDEAWGIIEYEALVERCGQLGVWFFGCTKWPESSDRGREIKEWIDVQNTAGNDAYKVSSFVILDDYDMNISTYFPDNFVKTDPSVGLTDEDARKAISILGETHKRKYVYY